MDHNIIYQGDCVAVMATLPECSVDAIVTDPPYHLTAMTKRFGKPGIQWLFGSGFPKSLDVSKAIDKAAGAEREVVGYRKPEGSGVAGTAAPDVSGSHIWTGTLRDRTPVLPAAQQWDGWGTALKPAAEMIVLARKPLAERSVAANVLEHGTAALNVDGCRIDAAGRPALMSPAVRDPAVKAYFSAVLSGSRAAGRTNLGRWPTNVILDDEAAAALDEQSGEVGGAAPASGPTLTSTSTSTSRGRFNGVAATPFHADSGGASRFFYTAKASASERNDGLSTRGNTHPTVKPVDLMAYLIKLVTPPGGVVLDPFLGSGTTAVAAAGLGVPWLGIEREPEYVEIARERIGLDCRVVVAAAAPVSPPT